MPVYIRHSELDIPSPSFSCMDVSEQDLFLDPAIVKDDLPQPFRMLNKILDQLMDDVWEAIAQRQLIREEKARMKQPSLFQPKLCVENLFNKSAMCHSNDGRYIFVSFQTGGLFAYDPVSFDCISKWNNAVASLYFEFISSSVIGHNIHLLATVDDLGFARLLLFVDESFFNILVLNEQIEGNPKTNAKKIDLSTNGDFCGLALECDHNAWLEFYKIPRDNWLREIEAAQKEIIKRAVQSEISVDDNPIDLPTSSFETIEIKFSPLIMSLKVKPPIPVTENPYFSQQDSLEKNLTGTVSIGTFHFTEEHLELRRSVVKKFYCDQHNNYDVNVDTFTFPTWHYLYPARMQIEPTVINSSVENVPVFACIWWSSSFLVQTYQLPLKPSKDLELKPELVWPFSANITCSTVSPCTNIIVFGKSNGFISVFNRNLCRLLCTVYVGEKNSVTDVKVVDSHLSKCKLGMSVVCCLVCLANGSIVFVDCLKNLTQKIVSSSKQNQQILVKPLSTLPNVFLHSIESSKTYFRNIESGDVICELALVESLDDPKNRFNVSNDEVFLFAKNDDNTLYMFDLREVFLLDKYRLEINPEKKVLTFKETMDERCQRFFAERISQQSKRVEELESSWSVMSKELFVLMGITQVDSLLSQTSKFPKWYKAAKSVIAHQQLLRR